LHTVELVLAFLGDQFLETTAREGVGELGVESGGAGGAPWSMIELLDSGSDCCQVDALFLFGTSLLHDRHSSLGTRTPAKNSGTRQ
jgi:hypothetical protein